MSRKADRHWESVLTQCVSASGVLAGAVLYAVGGPRLAAAGVAGNLIAATYHVLKIRTADRPETAA